MPLSTVDNTTFDAALAAVPAGYDGAWTRTGTTTDLDSVPMLSPNSNVRYHVKTAGGLDAYISYDELSNAQSLLDTAKEVLGERYTVVVFATFIEALYNIVTGSEWDPFGSAYELGSLQKLLKLFAGLSMFGIQFPFEAYREVSGSDFKNVALTANIASSVAGDPVAVITNTSTGLYHFALIDWGDGTIENIDSVASQPTISHTYGANSNFTIQVILIGPNGISVDTASALIAGA